MVGRRLQGYTHAMAHMILTVLRSMYIYIHIYISIPVQPALIFVEIRKMYHLNQCRQSRKQIVLWKLFGTWQFYWCPFWGGENVSLSKVVGDLQLRDRKVTLNHLVGKD